MTFEFTFSSFSRRKSACMDAKSARWSCDGNTIVKIWMVEIQRNSLSFPTHPTKQMKCDFVIISRNHESFLRSTPGRPVAMRWSASLMTTGKIQKALSQLSIADSNDIPQSSHKKRENAKRNHNQLSDCRIKKHLFHSAMRSLMENRNGQIKNSKWNYIFPFSFACIFFSNRSANTNDLCCGWLFNFFLSRNTILMTFFSLSR